MSAQPSISTFFTARTFQNLNLVQTMKNEIKLRYFRIESFRPKLEFEIMAGNFTVRTARTSGDIKRLLKFRYDVFFREDEMADNERTNYFDVDAYDTAADHLMVERAGEIIGTYRVLHSDFVEHFYSESEFHLEALLGLPGKKLELGRASVHPGHRAGIVLGLLWRGLGEYIRLSQPDFIFGCSSAKIVEPVVIQQLSRELNAKFADPDIRVFPRAAFQVPRTIQPTNALVPPSGTSHSLIPSLLSGYLALGARVCGEPALDHEFQCVDFLTVLRKENISDAFERRYIKTGA